MLLRSYSDLKVADANLLQLCVGTVALSTPLHRKGVPTELARGGEVRSTSKARVGSVFFSPVRAGHCLVAPAPSEKQRCMQYTEYVQYVREGSLVADADTENDDDDDDDDDMYSLLAGDLMEQRLQTS